MYRGDGRHTGSEGKPRWHSVPRLGSAHVHIRVPSDVAGNLYRASGKVGGPHHVASQQGLIAAEEQVATDAGLAPILQAESGREEVIRHLTADGQCIARDANIVLHRAIDDDALARGHEVAFNGTIDLDGATGDDQVALDGAIQGELSGPDVEVVVNHLVGLDDDHVPASTLKSPRCGDGEADGQQGYACCDQQPATTCIEPVHLCSSFLEQ
jgi:hypothetical protein